MNLYDVSSDFAIAFWIGPIPIPWYGILLLLGFLAVLIVSYIEWKKKNYNNFDFFCLFFVGVIVAIFGARWWYLLFNPRDYNGFISIFQISEGRSILGSIFACWIWIYIYTNFFASYIEFRRAFSIIIPNFLLGQAIGRWGNFFDQNVYGLVAENGLNFLPEYIRNGMYIDGAYRQPLFLYEALGDFAGFIYITFWLKQNEKIKPGVHGSVYIIWYGILRASMELFRDPAYIMKIGNVPTSFILSILFAVLGIFVLLYYQFYYESFTIFNRTYGKIYYQTKFANFKLSFFKLFIFKNERKVYSELILKNNFDYNNFKNLFPQNEKAKILEQVLKKY